MSIERFYRDVVVQRVVRTPNGMGGYIETWSDVGTIQGLINQASSKEILAASQFQDVIDSKLYCSSSEDILNTDRVKDSIEGSEIYQIVSVPKNTVNRGHHYKIFLKRLDTDG